MTAAEAHAGAVLGDLLAALRKRHALPWVVAHVPDGADPLPAAWAACPYPEVLVDLLAETGDPRYPAAEDAWGACQAASHARSCWGHGICRVCAAAVRAAVPSPPPLEAALAAARRG